MTTKVARLRMGTAYSAAYFGTEDGSVFDYEESDELKRVGSLFVTNLTRPGGFSIRTATHSGFVDVLVRSHSTKPDHLENESGWDDMAMSSFRSLVGELTAQPSPELLGDGSENLIDAPGTYAVRVLARGRDGDQPEDVNDTGPDSYLIDIWPANDGDVADDSVTTSDVGKEWIEVYRSI